jgi:hypothetical protein
MIFSLACLQWRDRADHDPSADDLNYSAGAPEGHGGLAVNSKRRPRIVSKNCLCRHVGWRLQRSS